MKTCEIDKGAIHRVTGHKVDLGPIKLFPIVGLEVPVKDNGFSTQITLSEDMFREGEGTLAEMMDPQTVGVYSYCDGFRSDRPICVLEGREINRAPFTRRHLRWVKEKTPQHFTEAAQSPGSTL